MVKLKKAVVVGVLLISMIGLNEVNILPSFLSEQTVYADNIEGTNLTWEYNANNRQRKVFININKNKVTADFTSAGGYGQYFLKMKVEATASDGTKRWSSPELVNQSIVLGELQQGDTLTLVNTLYDSSAVVPSIEGDGINGLSNKNIDFSFNISKKLSFIYINGSLHLKNVGQGQAQVTYNVNTADPDDPTANPDFTVLIPTEYQLSNKQKVSVGAVALKDAKDVTQNYAGDKAVKIAVTSAKNFQFDNGGTYKLVDGNKVDIPAEITLNKTAVSSVVNAQLTKEGSKTASADMLTFNYTVAP